MRYSFKPETKRTYETSPAKSKNVVKELKEEPRIKASDLYTAAKLNGFDGSNKLFPITNEDGSSVYDLICLLEENNWLVEKMHRYINRIGRENRGDEEYDDED